MMQIIFSLFFTVVPGVVGGIVIANSTHKLSVLLHLLPVFIAGLILLQLHMDKVDKEIEGGDK